MQYSLQYSVCIPIVILYVYFEDEQKDFDKPRKSKETVVPVHSQKKYFTIIDNG